MVNTEIRNITVKFGDKVLFITDNIIINQGETIALLGLNGTGKTTLLRIIAGLLKPSAGEISVYGKILYQPQKPAVFQMSVLQNAMVGMADPDKNKAIEILKSVELENFIYKPAKTLSGGEQQRLFLARSMLTGGDLMLLDEPFSAVDIKTNGKLNNILLEYCKKNNTSLIIATHSIKTAESVSDKCLLIKDSKLEICGIKSAKEYLISIL